MNSSTNITAIIPRGNIFRILWKSHKGWLVHRFMFLIVMVCSLLLPAQWSYTQSIYVDACAGINGIGTIELPYNTLARAVAVASPGSHIFMKGGGYPESLIINKALTITAYDGTAIVGTDRNGVTWRDVIIDLGSGISTNARIYYPSCGNGPFPAVVYAHGRRVNEFNICGGLSSPPLNEDYKQLEGILTFLASSEIIAISFNWQGLTVLDQVIAGYIVKVITYLGKEFGNIVDLQNIGLIGHSTGGAAVIKAARILRNDPNSPVQIKGLGLIAPAFPSGETIIDLAEPVLVIHGTNEHPCQAGLAPLEIYCQAASPKHLVYLIGANHFGYTDDICIDPNQVRSIECSADPFGLDPRDYLLYSPGWDNGSEVGGMSGRDPNELQMIAAANYLKAFFSFYLQGNVGELDYLTHDGEQCGHPGDPQACMNDLLINPPSNCQPTRYFEDLQYFNVEVFVCACLR